MFSFSNRIFRTIRKRSQGIVPITCDNLFQHIEGTDDGTKFEVKFSMLEIYSEQVRDLLSSKVCLSYFQLYATKNLPSLKPHRPHRTGPPPFGPLTALPGPGTASKRTEKHTDHIRYQ